MKYDDIKVGVKISSTNFSFFKRAVITKIDGEKIELKVIDDKPQLVWMQLYKSDLINDSQIIFEECTKLEKLIYLVDDFDEIEKES